ncbi:methionine aminopeptidase, type I [Candidatus Blochmanniella vafra str. BVAF]|uniref:Methionine aminopeptidase n=1 Tax=Blochmanniella vafra (strain BVAF) TaxID=859654 RepID=E8Q655_BLOVB|nr:type I methionyl aminopeptidase [Candidatus Blochmannia vafer]ADV33671.1 methionine aminopeptidase, type I [Candidatus Blochmannia vafer str. BVAF]
MNIAVNTPKDIEKMRVAGRLAAEVLEMIEPYVLPGISTEKLNNICHDYITKVQKAIAAPLGYHGFPKSICTSINDVVCHGIPHCSQKLKDGDIINIDVTIIKQGFHADTSKMFTVGTSTQLGNCLCQVTQTSLYKAINIIRPGIRLKMIGKTIQNIVNKKNFSIVREYCGHGIGKLFHEPPHVLNYDADDGGVILKSGMIFTIEPMVNAGKRHVYTESDGWTVKTQDHSLSAQYEHTILITKTGCEILTKRTNETLPNYLFSTHSEHAQ